MNIAIFASGSGTNAQNIAQYFAASDRAKVALIVCNNPNAFVLERAKNLGIPAYCIPKSQLSAPCEAEAPLLSSLLDKYDIGMVVLAGYLLKVPIWLIERFKGRILNIHPSLLPLYGGKGMYGDKVHEAVIKAGEKESGVTVHLVDGEYDHGSIVLQAKCPVEQGDTPHTLASRIHSLEYDIYPKAIELVLPK